ncbi:MAG: AAA family ATPase, partial [Deltaproteobacteria bacterium]|nr:AAA family ATPase [Deltaproteobacteria bacterium]
GEIVFILRDYHQCWHNQPRIIRKLRTLGQKLKYTKKTIIITTPRSVNLEELKDEMVVLDFTPPGPSHLKKILKGLLSAPDVKCKLTKHDYETMINASLGLTSNQAQRVFSKAIVSNGILDIRDIDMINQEKKSIIRQSDALELYTTTDTIADVGGVDVLKNWLKMRERAFSKEAKKYGLPSPKGVALIGIPGTGKSLAAKMVANLWGLALIRADIGALFGSLVGQSEENTRRALNLVETIAPCVLWIDEIEKGLSVGEGDGGTSMRVFAQILSWMQEKSAPVFIVATANDINRLPPELLRRGRFDEIFFLDLPTSVERQEIFKVHIKKRNRDPQAFDLDRLVSETEGYVGAEIEQAVVEGMYIAFNDLKQPARELNTEDLLAAIHKLIPMSKSQRETIGELRRWLLEGRAQSASFDEAKQAERQFVNIQLESALT